MPVVVWAVVIFSASTDAMSSQRTSRIIGPLLRWLHPNVAPETIETVQYAARKGAHVLEYAILSVLLWRALSRTETGRTGSASEPSCPGNTEPGVRLWRWRPVMIAFLGAHIYAVSDEAHQWFVASRGASVSDVGLDTAGAALGLFTVWIWGRWRKAW